MATRDSTIDTAAPFAYVRVKLNRTTAFVEAELGRGGATGRWMRLTAGRLLGVCGETLRILRRLGDGFVVLEDDKSLHEQDVGSDGILVAVQRDADGRWGEPCLDAIHT